MSFTDAEITACRDLIHAGLEEDLSAVGDVTSLALIPLDLTGEGEMVARAPGILAGLPAADLVFATLNPSLRFDPLQAEGGRIAPGTKLARVSGSMRSILSGERTALNFIQHLSGIATRTRQYVDAIAGTASEILDTRKTLPGWRLLEKYAVRCGGGHNHRLGLYDGILIKDNHLAALRMADGRLQIEEAVRRARSYRPSRPVEIEVDNLEQFDRALGCNPDIILLDNMGPEHLREAVRRRNARCILAAEGFDTSPKRQRGNVPSLALRACVNSGRVEYNAPAASARVLLEASGGITLETVRAVAETGVDRISIGALTHSAPALDIALDYLA